MTAVIVATPDSMTEYPITECVSPLAHDGAR
jgi:hypothetical protein